MSEYDKIPTAAIKRPVARGRLRLALGRTYFTFVRRLRWQFGGLRFARQRGEILPYVYCNHRTPLLRRLKNVDMYLQYNKIINLKLAVACVNGVTLYPGETFSYWKLIGKPTKRKGYLPGMVLRNGRCEAGTGGGLCQLSNLIFWITLHTPLTVTERHRHGYDVFPDADRTQPFGSGATCFYNYKDLMITNNTDRTYQLTAVVTEDELKGEWRSELPPDTHYAVYEKVHLIRLEYWGGYTRHNIIYRKKYDESGTLLNDEFVAENHAVMMYEPLLPGSV